MTALLYLGLLVVGICCMLALDRRFTLFFWRNARAATVVMAVGVAVLLAADVSGIALGLFVRGVSSVATGVVLAPHMPLEEPIFLAFLVLTTAISYTGALNVLARRPAGAGQ